MKTHLRPGLEEMNQEGRSARALPNMDEFVEHAISLLHKQEAWLAEHGTGIQAKI